MAAAMREIPWAATSLGPLHAWPQSLKTLVGVMLATRQPMFIIWGSQRTWLHNDAFLPILADQYSHAVGRPALQVWAHARATLEPHRYANDPSAHMDRDTLLEQRDRIAQFSREPGDNRSATLAIARSQKLHSLAASYRAGAPDERLRIEEARSRVQSSLEAIERVAETTGFGDPERMRRAFIRAFGQPPQSLRRAARAG